MKILWITNILFPSICEELNLPKPVTGGWMYSSLKELKKTGNLEFAVATVYQGKEFVTKQIDNVWYYLLPLGRKSNLIYQPVLESYWRKVQQDFLSDVVHIHGTEFAHGLAYLNACSARNVVVSIQGLISVIGRYYYAGIGKWDILKHITFRDIIRRDTIFHQKHSFMERGKIEKEILWKVDHVIGRTSWDKAHVWAINPKAQYHFCNETLRDGFYKYQWRYEECEKHSIFLSQAGYPIKGLHQVLKAMPLILKHYPDAKVFVAGDDIIKRPWYRLTGYGAYIKHLIKQYKLENHVFFTGLLNEQEICKQYLKSNVFVCPSAIENSPNSLGEAQLLGVPCIAAYAGGVPDMMKGCEDFVYRFEEVEMLADKVCKIFHRFTFRNADFTQEVLSRHDRVKNQEDLLNIYCNIIAHDSCNDN